MSKPSWDFEEGAEIAPGRTVLKALGGGNLTEVLLVWDQRLHAITVAKLIRPDRAGEERALAELRQEAEILDQLAHPVIVRGLDIAADGEHPHLLLEHLEGPSLRRLIKNGGPLPVQQLLPLMLHLAGALHYMEQERVVHLDLKPDNVIMSVPPRLIDLSIARSFEAAAEVSSPIGTDAYMAPEQCAPERFPGAIGSAADVWGLGATIFHAASGERPFPRSDGDRDAEDEAKRFPQLVEPPVDLPEHVPEGLRELIGEMLAPEPGERPGAAEVAARLEPLIVELPSKLVLSRRGMRTH